MSAIAKLDLGLERISRVLTKLGNPETSFLSIHVAGTNGKGSTCAFLTSCLEAVRHGKKKETKNDESTGSSSSSSSSPFPFNVGEYVSPFLVSPRDAVLINGEVVSEVLWNEALSLTSTAAASVDVVLTTFELWTAAAFLCFQKTQVTIAVIEVGVGGATDATNVIPPPLVSVITSISYDHVELLGPSLSHIATHKAGIIKRGTAAAVMVPNMHPDAAAVIRERAKEMGVQLVEPVCLEWAMDHGVGSQEKRETNKNPHNYCKWAVEPFKTNDRGSENSSSSSSSSSSSGSVPHSTTTATSSQPLLIIPLPLRGDFQLQNASGALAALRVLQSHPQFQAALAKCNSQVTTTTNTTTTTSASAAADDDDDAKGQITNNTYQLRDNVEIIEGFASTKWRGRLEWVEMEIFPEEATTKTIANASASSAAITIRTTTTSPSSSSSLPTLQFLLDGGHNEGALPLVRNAIDEEIQRRTQYQANNIKHADESEPPSSVSLLSSSPSSPSPSPKVLFIYGATASRSLLPLLPLLLRAGDTVFSVPFTTPEGMPWVKSYAPSVIQETIQQMQFRSNRGSSGEEDGNVEVVAFASLDEALQEAYRRYTAPSNVYDLVVCCGSLYLVADVYRRKKRSS